MNEPHYPDGKLNEDDEGELAIAIGIEKGKVMVQFEEPVAWFGLPPEQAIELGETLIKRGHEAIDLLKH